MPFVYHPDVAAVNAQGLPNALPTIDLPTIVPNGYNQERSNMADFVPYNPAIVEATIRPAGNSKVFTKPTGPANPPTWAAILRTVKTGLVGTGSANMATGNVQSTVGGTSADNSGQTNSGGGGSKSIQPVSPGGNSTR